MIDRVVFARKFPLQKADPPLSDSKEELPVITDTEADADWEFDFSIYENVDKEEIVQDTSIFARRSRVSRYKSRFSNSGMLMTNLCVLERDIIKSGIKVSKFTQDINDLWDFYSCVTEYWEYIKLSYDQNSIDGMGIIRNKCIALLEEYTTKTPIDKKVHNYLLFFRHKALDLAQLRNYRFETEKFGATGYENRIRGQ